MDKLIRYSENILLQVIDNQTKLMNFVARKDNPKQWVGDSQQEIRRYIDNKDKRLNKVFNTKNNYSFESGDIIREQKQYKDIIFYIRQNYTELTKFFGFMVCVCDQHKNVIFNSVIYADDFSLNSDHHIQRLDNDFWATKYVLRIPNSKENTFISIIPIEYSMLEMDESSPQFGKIYTYDSVWDFLEPLTYNKLFPETISVKIVKEGSFIKIGLDKKDKNITFEKAIIEYLNLEQEGNSNIIHNIKVDYQISIHNVGENNHRSLQISNLDNTFSSIYIAPYIYQEIYNNSKDIELIVKCSIKVNNLYNISRSSSILLERTNDILSNTIFDKTKVADFSIVELKIDDKTQVNNNVIETKTKEVFIPIVKHVYVSMIEDDKLQVIPFESKIISFKNIVREKNSIYQLVLMDKDGKSLEVINNLETEFDYLLFDLFTPKYNDIVAVLNSQKYVNFKLYINNTIYGVVKPSLIRTGKFVI